MCALYDIWVKIYSAFCYLIRNDKYFYKLDHRAKAFIFTVLHNVKCVYTAQPLNKTTKNCFVIAEKYAKLAVKSWSGP